MDIITLVQSGLSLIVKVWVYMSAHSICMVSSLDDYGLDQSSTEADEGEMSIEGKDD